MEFLNKNRNKDDLEVLGKICFDTITSPYVSKPNSDEFCGIYIESRNRELTCIEDLAAIKSFKIFSEHNYPVLVFCNNFSNFLGNHKDVKDWRIQFIKINECQSHDDYSLFMIKQLFKIIPKEYENIIFLHNDGFLIKSGWENYLKEINVDYIGSPWAHTPSIDIFDDDIKKWKPLNFQPINVGGGGFSFRKLSKFRKISEEYSGFILRERYREDNRWPPEDLFFSNILNGTGIGKVADIKQAIRFSLDPITLIEYLRKSSFGFHYPTYKNNFQQYREYHLSL